MKKLSIFIFFLVLFLLPVITHAQVEAPPDGGGDPGDLNAPIDGGLSLLLAAGTAYGVKKCRNIKKENKK